MASNPKLRFISIESECAEVFYLLIFNMATPVSFLRETSDELKKVIWPTRNEVIRLTAIVIMISVLIGLYIGGLDYVFTQLMGLILK